VTGEPQPQPGIDTAAAQAIVRRRLFDPTAPLHCVGRYRIVATLGRGGMGRVYSAFDPELDRVVALKLLHDHADDPQRLRREARALAQLNHPNVVAVFEVGVHEGQLFVAMEQVRGVTLRAWLCANHRRPRTIVPLLVQAGRALAAAHAVGIVHRDFKPDNAMVADDGRVRVLDFGLAIGSRSDDGDHSETTFASEDGDSSSLRTAGTPGYIAPEVRDGAIADARSDQYSYCVSAWEALCGVRPAALETDDTDASEHQPGDLPDAALRRVLERGLERDPARRWPTMDALLAALVGTQTRARRRLGGGILASIAAITALGLGWTELDERRRVSTCRVAGDPIAVRWPGTDDSVRIAVRDGLLATEAAYAKASVDRVEPTLDGYAADLAAARVEICHHSDVERDWDPELIARADACVAHRELVLSGLVHRLPTADTTTLRLAVAAADALPRVADCLDVEALHRLPPRPTGADEEVTSIREHLGNADAARLMASYDEMIEALERAVAESVRLDWTPLVVDARLRLSVHLGELGHHDRAESMMTDAYYLAAGAGLDNEASHAAAGLLALVGGRMLRFDDGLRWSRLARLHRVRAGDIDPYLRERTLAHLALLYMSMGDLPIALAHAELAAELSREYVVEGSPEALGRDNLIAAIRMQLGEISTAIEILRRLADASEVMLGPDHPDTAFALDNLAAALTHAGRYDEARVLVERALTIRERSLPPDHPELVSSLLSLGITESARGEHARASELDRRAYDLASRVHGPDHPITMLALGNLASDDMALGDFEAARAGYARACDLREVALGPDHPDLARSFSNLAATEVELGLLDEAREHVTRAIEIYETRLGAHHVTLASFLTLRGEIELRSHHESAARPYLERALALQATEPLPSDERAATRWGLARALWPEPRERARARSLARDAAALYREHPEKTPRDLAAVDAWLIANDR